MNETGAETDYDIIVVGGGASGMMAGAIAAENGARVMLLEKNERLGEKLRITGGGRCNITNAEFDLRALLSKFGDDGKYLFSAYTRFGVQDTIDYFQDRNLPIKVEGRKRAFPVTENASDVVQLLHKQLIKHGATIRPQSKVTKINVEDGQVISLTFNNQTITAKKYIIATGGKSRPETGSTGEGMKWLQQHGHEVKEPTPNITPIEVKDDWVDMVSGIVLTDVNVDFYLNDKKQFRETGNILFTHFGLSGPTILNSSYKLPVLLKQGTVEARIDCYPALDHQQLNQKIIDTLALHKAKQLKNILPHFLPAGLKPAVMRLLRRVIDFDINGSELSKDNRKVMVDLLKSLPLTVTGLMGFEKAVVADGGLSLNQIDTRTMQSKLLPNLYVTGDLLHINRPSGGYSLQLCWTTGYIAGLHAATED